ncbi:MAG: hypothetical protein IJ206_08465 [Oscillospiraceae bacterium]|nr:hypothetical protein [Oscillospiraceae bacterium]
MDIKFPERENPFPKTMIQAVLSCLAALAVGLFLGNALGAFFGTDESVIHTSTYTDRMSAIRTVFTDGDQLDSYARTALAMADMDGLRLYTSRNRDHVKALWQEDRTDAFSLFDDEIRRSLLELMNTEDALYGLETAGGSPITDVWLRNIAVEDGVVYYYLYYDEAGFAGLAFDSTHETLYGTDNAMPLTKTSADGDFEWFIIYDMGE